MLCQKCSTKQATVHLTKIVNNSKTEMHLCQQCASQSGELEFDLEPKFSIHHFFAGLLGAEGMETPLNVAPEAKIQCEKCGLTYAQFSQIGYLGCGQCYKYFGEKLGPLLRKIHGSNRHTGKVPRRSGTALKIKKDIERLRGELKKRVSQEEFEEAARLRDEIRGLENNLESGEEKDAG